MNFAIVTPSHAPDFHRFRTLHESVQEHTPADTQHYVLVPPLDIRQFSSIASDRLQVLSQIDVFPRTFIATTRLSRLPRIPRGYRVAAVNLRHPWPPIRGWIFQQLVKLGFVACLDADVAIILDSDLVLIRDIREDVFRKGDSVRHYRLPYGLNPTMTRHLRWREGAARLLGLDSPSGDFADCVAGLMSWSPTTVRAMLARVESVSGRHWASELGSQLEFSEYILYGEYITGLGSAPERSFTANTSLCYTYWGPEPLTLQAVPAFLDLMPSTDVALLIQSNTNTPDDVLDHVVSTVRGGRL